jgi:hypothetical protein
LPFFISWQKRAKNNAIALTINNAIALTFRPFLATFAIFHKWAKKQQKSKAIALTFRPFLVQSFFETVHYCDEWENSHLSYIRYHRVNFPGGVYDLSWW